MAASSDVRDDFRTYYTEKLWQLVPEVYRSEDGLSSTPGVLRQIIEVIAADAAEARRSIDRLWEDQHIETCDDWAVPYIGDLVGTRLVPIADRRARRVDVASTIRYRRRRGTPGLLKELVRSFSGWDTVLVEGFQRLARMYHRLSPLPVASGLYSQTLPGGTADLRNTASAELSESPFGEFYHTLDTRRLVGREGQFGIRKLNFHLYRYKAYVIEASDAVELPASGTRLRSFAVDPSGRDIQLFIDAEAPEDFCGPTFEWDVTQAMRCRLLGHVAYAISESHVSELAALSAPPLAVDLNAMRRVLRTRFASEPAMRRRLIEFGAVITAVPPSWYRRLVELALLENTGKARLYPRQVQVALAGDLLSTAEVRSGDLSDRECQPDASDQLTRVLVSPEIGRLATIPSGTTVDDAPQVLRYAYGFSGEVGAGPYPRTLEGVTTRVASSGVIPDGGVLQGDGLTFDDNRTYDLTIRSDVPLTNSRLQASDGRRPLIRLHGNGTNPTGANLIPASEGQTFVANGGWYISSEGNAAPGTVSSFVVEGLSGADTATFDFDRFELNHLTLDPGGLRADGTRIAPLRLYIRGQIRRLVVKRSITGPIVVAAWNTDPLARVETLIVCDSIIDASQSADHSAIVNALGEVVLEGCTVFGNVTAGVLRASTSIVTGTVRVANNQSGCFRFSASSPGLEERLPPRYRDVHLPISATYFKSMRFGDPDYAQLSIVAPEEMAGGAENGSEMGVFSYLLSPIRLRSIKAKVDEFGPVGVLAQYLFEEPHLPGAGVLAGALDIAPEALPVPPMPVPGDVIPTEAPPPTAPLPTECPDDAKSPNESVRIAPIDVASADLSGAPTFWRETDWSGEVQWPGESARISQGIPFDRVQHLLEFDARFMRPPVDSGLRSHGGARSTFKLEKGVLRFEIPSGANAVFAQIVNDQVPSNTPPLHAYATLRVSSEEQSATPASGADTKAGFGIGIWLEEEHNVGLVARMSGQESLANGPASTAPEAANPITDGNVVIAGTHYTRVALQADFAHDLGILVQDDRIQKARLGRVGDLTSVTKQGHSDTPTRSGNKGARLWAFFGVDNPNPSTSGELLNFVVSSPGRFIRAWFATTSPWSKPQLRLEFSGSLKKKGQVQVIVRYGVRHIGAPAVAFPRFMLNTSIQMNQGSGLGQLELSHVTANEPLWLTIERDSRHREDDYVATARLLQLSFVGTSEEVP